MTPKAFSLHENFMQSIGRFFFFALLFLYENRCPHFSTVDCRFTISSRILTPSHTYTGGMEPIARNESGWEMVRCRRREAIKKNSHWVAWEKTRQRVTRRTVRTCAWPTWLTSRKRLAATLCAKCVWATTFGWGCVGWHKVGAYWEPRASICGARINTNFSFWP